MAKVRHPTWPGPGTRPASPRALVVPDLDGGLPLEGGVRRDLEGRFGYDLSRVRIHAGDRAGTSAREAGASAYTVGRHIVFGPGRYEPRSARGRALLVHELTHTIQQGMAEPAPHDGTALAAGHPAEREAAGAARPGAGAGRITVRERTAPALARQAEPAPGEAGAGAAAGPAAAEAESSGSSMMDSLIDNASIAAAKALRTSAPIPIPETVLAALTAAEAAFVGRGFRRLVMQGELLEIAGRVRELADWKVAAEFGLRYLWGVLKGLASPVTGLVQFAKSGVELAAAAGSWAAEHLQQTPEVGTEATGLVADWENFRTAARASLESLQTKEGALAFAGSVFSAAEAAGAAIEHQLVAMAREQGGNAADRLVNELRKTPLPELAERAGEIVGMVVIEVVMLAFSDGIGNLIAKLGEFARSLRPLSRGIGAIADVMVGAGRVIADLEHIVGALMSKTVLRPLRPLLEALEPLLARAQKLSQRLLGLSEEAGTGLGRAGARALTPGKTSAADTAEHALAPPAPAHAPPHSAAVPAGEVPAPSHGPASTTTSGAPTELPDVDLSQATRPEVTGGKRPRIDDVPVRTRQTRRMDIGDFELLPGETSQRQALTRINRLRGRRIDETPLGRVWEEARRDVVGSRSLANATREDMFDLYNEVRDRFWDLARKDAESARFLEETGFEFGSSRAPALKVNKPDIPIQERRISLDHNLEKALGENYKKAIDADNLTFEFHNPNSNRETVQVKFGLRKSEAGKE